MKQKHPLNAGAVGKFISASAFILLASPLYGASVTWSAGSGGNWVDSANWSNSTAPGVTSGGTTNADSALFVTSGGGTVTVDANRNLQNISFDGAAGAFTLSGGNLLLSAGGTIQVASSMTSASKAQTINTPITLGGNYTFANNNATSSNTLNFGSAAAISTAATSGNTTLTLAGLNTGANTIAGTISDNSDGHVALVKTGTGSWTLSGANNYSGGTTIKGGTLTVDASTGSLASTGNLTFGSISYGTGGTFVYDNTTSTSARSQTLGALAFKSGDGTVKSNRTAAQNVNLSFSSWTAPTAGATANFVVTGGVNGTSNAIALTGQATGFINASTFFGGSNYAWYDAAGFVRGIDYANDAGAVTTGAGTSLPTTGVGGGQALYVKTTGAISAQGSQTISTLNLASTGGVTLTAGSVLTVNGILKSGGNAATISGTTGSSIKSADGTDLVIRTDLSTDALTLSTSINNGTNGLVKSGAGTLSIKAANTYTGTTYLNGGTINNGGVSSSISNALGTGQLIINAGTIGNSTNGSYGFSLSNSSQTWAGDFALTLYAGSGPTLNMGTGPITITGDRTIYTSGALGAGSSISVGGAISDGGNGYGVTWAPNGTTAGTVRVNLGTAASSYTGVTTITGGYMQFGANVASGANSAFGNATSDILLGATSGTAGAAILVYNTTASFSRNITLQSGGTGTLYIGSVYYSKDSTGSSTNMTNTGNITLGTGATGRSVTLHQGNFSGNIVDPAGLVSNPGVVTIGTLGSSQANGDSNNTVTLSGNNTFSGGVNLVNTNTVSGKTATLAINSSNAIGTGTFTIAASTGAVAIDSTVAGGTTLSTNNAQVWNNDFSFTGSQNLNMGTGAVSLGTSAGAVRTITTNGTKTLTIGGGISDGTNVTTPTTGLTKAGAGTLVLGGVNTYSGATTVNAGELDVNGSLSATSQVSVNTGATLGGNGTVYGSVAVNAGSMKGSGAGLTVSGSATFTGTSTLSGNTTVSGGISAASGTLALTGTTTGNADVVNGAVLTHTGKIIGDVTVHGVMSGAGTVDGSLSVLSGGALSLKTGASSQIVTEDFSLASGAALSLRVNKTLAGSLAIAGTDYDQIAVGGDISLGGTLALTLGTGIEMNDTFVLLLNSGDNAITGHFSAITVNGDSITLSEGNQFTYNSLDYRLLYDGNADGGTRANDLELVVVPEPTTWALVAGGLGMLALGRRVRRFSREA